MIHDMCASIVRGIFQNRLTTTTTTVWISRTIVRFYVGMFVLDVSLIAQSEWNWPSQEKKWFFCVVEASVRNRCRRPLLRIGIPFVCNEVAVPCFHSLRPKWYVKIIEYMRIFLLCLFSSPCPPPRSPYLSSICARIGHWASIGRVLFVARTALLARVHFMRRSMLDWFDVTSHSCPNRKRPIAKIESWAAAADIFQLNVFASNISDSSSRAVALQWINTTIEKRRAKKHAQKSCFLVISVRVCVMSCPAIRFCPQSTSCSCLGTRNMKISRGELKLCMLFYFSCFLRQHICAVCMSFNFTAKMAPPYGYPTDAQQIPCDTIQSIRSFLIYSMHWNEPSKNGIFHDDQRNRQILIANRIVQQLRSFGQAEWWRIASNAIVILASLSHQFPQKFKCLHIRLLLKYNRKPSKPESTQRYHKSIGLNCQNGNNQTSHLSIFCCCHHVSSQSKRKNNFAEKWCEAYRRAERTTNETKNAENWFSFVCFTNVMLHSLFWIQSEKEFEPLLFMAWLSLSRLFIFVPCILAAADDVCFYYIVVLRHLSTLMFSYR